MNLDDLQTTWADQTNALSTNLQLNKQMLRQITIQRVRGSLRWSAALQGLRAVPTLAVTVLLARFIHGHMAEAKFWIPAVLLELYFVSSFAFQARQIALTLHLEYSQPLAAIQRQIEMLRISRIRFSQWVVFTMVPVWTPAVIVALKGFFGADAYRLFGWNWIAWNVLIAALLIPLLRWISRRLSTPNPQTHFSRRLMRDIAGYNLVRAQEFLNELSNFENEDTGGR